MEHFDKEFCLEVWGPMACFTRPELKVERVSYDVITPSAARAIFEAIFWKPAIRWEITRIEVLNPIKWTSIRRNELKFSKKESFYFENERTQRNTLLLKDVRYRIFAKMVFIPLQKRIKENPIYQSWFDSTSDSYKSSKNPIIDYCSQKRRAYYEKADSISVDDYPDRFASGIALLCRGNRAERD